MASAVFINTGGRNIPCLWREKRVIEKQWYEWGIFQRLYIFIQLEVMSSWQAEVISIESNKDRDGPKPLIWFVQMSLDKTGLAIKAWYWLHTMCMLL